jgi:hypothetical protein
VALREALAGLGFASVSAAIALVAMWAAGWFHDVDVRREQLWLLVVPAAVGAFAGLRYGALAGLAVLLAVGGVLFGLVLGWGLTGGDGEPDTHLAGICGLGVFVTSVVAAALAARNGGDATPAQLGIMLLPAALAVLGSAAAAGAGRVQAAAIAVLVYAAPPALLAVA